jgi:hypothetical protein
MLSMKTHDLAQADGYSQPVPRTTSVFYVCVPEPEECSGLDYVDFVILIVIVV